MQKKLISLAIILTAGVAGFLVLSFAQEKQITYSPAPSPKPSPVAFATISMDDEGFKPDTIEIKRYTQVMFKNNGTADHWPASNLHPTHGIYPEFDPQVGIEPGKEWSFVFDKIGRWKFHDHLFPLVHGEIVVTP
jgi:hypothetical protein